MQPLDFWFEHVESGDLVMHAPGIALVFSRDRGLAHALWVDSGSAAPAIGFEFWLVRSGEFADQEIEEAQGRRKNPHHGPRRAREGPIIDNPVYQEIVPHELADERRAGVCALLTGSCFDHHFSAVFSLYRELKTPQCIVLDVDVADRCRGSVEKLAATYSVSERWGATDTKQDSPSSAAWRDFASNGGLLELVAIPPAIIGEPASSVNGRVQIQALIDSKTHTQRLCYRWRWTSSSGLTR
jgi:hypothetical protein